MLDFQFEGVNRTETASLSPHFVKAFMRTVCDKVFYRKRGRIKSKCFTGVAIVTLMQIARRK